jgi:pimeloyl-ACP methyl ester carboxylesterase
MERVDLGPCQALHHKRDPDRCVVLLPGLFYPTRSPVLWFAREAANACGWSALEVLGEPGREPDPLGWERECADRALATLQSASTVVIGKSLASLLTGPMSERGLPAIWLTPLLNETAVIDALAGLARPTLLVGGTADPTWQRERVPANHSLQLVEIPHADHSLQIRGDLEASIEALGQLTGTITSWLAHELRSVG